MTRVLEENMTADSYESGLSGQAMVRFIEGPQLSLLGLSIMLTSGSSR